LIELANNCRATQLTLSTDPDRIRGQAMPRGTRNAIEEAVKKQENPIEAVTEVVLHGKS
jgi:hypothetical protein